MAIGRTALTQVACLSNRPAILAETLSYVRHFMPWVRQAVVLAPDVEVVRRAVGDADVPELVVVDEHSLLASGEVLPAQHSARNAALRRLLLARGPVDDVFLQADDDYRPLKPVDPSMFIDDDGRLIHYAFHDLSLWRRNESTFDAAQHASYLALSYLGAEHLSYGSHMPQPIDRVLYLEAFTAAERLTDDAFCDWALPLNYSRHVAPERHAPPRTFRTMCWPQYPHMWPYWRRPEDLTFENFYPEMYAPGQLFHGISTALDIEAPQRQAFAKISRWHHFDVEAGRLRFPQGVGNPWETSAGRRAFFGLARRARRMYEYVALEERAQLAQLAGTVAQLNQAQIDQEQQR